ncbi:MAG TPA: shikimate kinase [Myxococcota bacterium]|nr:shikimate kinase [Myxococcota bacterium]HQK51709.1 shikimate kinase [Myxococcota bacterium]
MGLHIVGVVGNPVGHSISPTLHRHWIRLLGLPATYLAVHGRDLASISRLWTGVPFRGLNVTRPFKEALVALADDLEPTARRIGAVNTLWRLEAGATHCIGANTDPDGVQGALASTGVPWEGRPALVLGAGGAARGAVAALTDARCPVHVLNRTVDRAKDLARDLGVGFGPLEDLPRWLPHVGVVVSTLPRDAVDALGDPGPMAPGTVVLEADYAGEAPSPLASRGGTVMASPREWLLHQGASAFQRFFDLPPALEDGRTALWAAAPRPRRIALVGFMGAGKTTLAPQVARLLGWSSVDLDQEVADRLGMSIPEVLRHHGEEVFRQAEEDMLRSLAHRDRIVVACGGGTPLRPGSRAVLRGAFWTVWVFVTLPGARERLVRDGGERPLWKDESPAVQEALWTARRDACAQVSDLLVDGEGVSPEMLAQEIADEARVAL